jgi:hypothetical protein
VLSRGVGLRGFESHPPHQKDSKKLFTKEDVDEAFVWLHRSHKVAIELYQQAGIKEVGPLGMAFVP